MGIAVVSQLMARRSNLTCDLRMATDIETTLKEGGPDAFAIQILQDLQRTFTRSVVERQRDSSAPSRAPVDGWPEDLGRARESSISGGRGHGAKNSAGRNTS